MTQNYRGNVAGSNNNQSNGFGNRNNNQRNSGTGNNQRNPGNGNRNNNRNNGGNNPNTQRNNPGNNTLLDDEFWKGNRNQRNNSGSRNGPQLHWKAVSIVLATVFVVGALVGGLAIHAASDKGAKTESTVLFCQNGGGLLGISCH